MSMVPVDIKKLCGYPHNGYPTDMDTGTRHIFIQWVGYGGTTTRTLPVPLTSLVTTRSVAGQRKPFFIFRSLYIFLEKINFKIGVT